MNITRTAILAALLGLVALPAMADSLTFDLPRLEFPIGPDATRADGSAVTLPVQVGN